MRSLHPTKRKGYQVGMTGAHDAAGLEIGGGPPTGTLMNVSKRPEKQASKRLSMAVPFELSLEGLNSSGSWHLIARRFSSRWFKTSSLKPVGTWASSTRRVGRVQPEAGIRKVAGSYVPRHGVRGCW